MTGPQHYNVLFLCTRNASRSILAESILNHIGGGRFTAYSGGSFPNGTVNPVALALLTQLDFPTEGLRSKSWDEYATPDAPQMDFIITLCDDAANEICPVWPGQPATAHWGLSDPSTIVGTETERWAAFRETFHTLERRLRIFTSLPVVSLDRLSLLKRLGEIGLSEQHFQAIGTENGPGNAAPDSAVSPGRLS